MHCLVAAAVAALAATATAAGAPQRTVSLALVGAHTKALFKCGPEKIADAYSAVRPGVAFTLAGSVQPVPTRPAWHARVVVKRCIDGHYTKVWTGIAAGRQGGTFRIAYTPRSSGLLIAVADYGRRPNVFSQKIRLHVG